MYAAHLGGGGVAAIGTVVARGGIPAVVQAMKQFPR
jgi:hypothetical protein